MIQPALPAILAVQFVATLATYPAIRWTGWGRRAAFAAAMAVVMLAPAAIDAEHRVARLVAALWAAWMSPKLLDLACGTRPDERMGVAEFVLYVVNPLWLVHRLRPI